MNEHVTALDKLLFVGVVLLSVLGILLVGLLPRSKGEMVEVRVAGELYGTYPLSPQTLHIPVAYGEAVVQIGPDGAAITEAGCPDGQCMREGPISQSGQSLICLPGRLVITVTGKGGGADVTTY